MAIIGMHTESSTPSSAETGDTISCEFVLENNDRYTRMVWWSISDYSSGSEVRLKTDEFTLAPYSSINITKSLSMPSHDLQLKFHTGYVGETGWVMTDESVRPTIAHDVSTGSLFVRALDAVTNDYLWASVYLNNIYKGTTSGWSGLLISNISPGFHTLYLTNNGYNGKTVSVYVSAGTNSEDVGMTPTPTLGTLAVTAKDTTTGNAVTGAPIHITDDWNVLGTALCNPEHDTGYTTPHTFELDPGTYRVVVCKDHYQQAFAKIVTISTGGSDAAECDIAPKGMQCPVGLPDIDVPASFNPVDLLFRIKMWFTIGDFTYSYIGGWVNYINTPAPNTVINAIAAATTVTVNDNEVTPYFSSDPTNNSTMFDLITTIKNLITSGGIQPNEDITIKITYPTQLWFDTLDFTNNEAVDTATKTLTIPQPASLCSFAPTMTGPPEIPITLPALPALPPTIGDSLLDIGLGAVCENLTSPAAVPIKLFLFGSGTPAISTSVSPTSYTPDLSSHILPAITALIAAGTPIPDNMGILLQCPAEYSAAGFSADMVETSLAIPLSVPPPVDVICSVGITPIQPPSISVNLPEFGVPGLNLATLPIAGIMGIVCKEDGVAVPTPPGVVVPDIDLYVMNEYVTTLSVDLAGNFSYNIISLITPADLIDQNIDEISVELWYPSLVGVSGAIPDGVTLLKKKISIPVTLPGIPPGPTDIFCDMVANVAPPSLPLRMSTLGQLSLDTTTALPLSMTLTPSCDGDIPTNPFEGLARPQLLIGGVPFAALDSFDTSGSTSVNLATYQSVLLPAILSSIAQGAITGSLTVEVKYALKVKYSTPVVQEWDTKTVYIPFTIAYDVPPACVLTTADYITCDDGSVIPIRMCLPDGSKVNIIPTPTCPDIPPPPGECVLTTADYFTCPDGTVIQLNECMNGVKVPTGATCPPPPGPGECVLTTADYFTCPDGTVIQLNKCVNGVKVPTGATCPPPPGPGECVLTAADYFTCPDGTVIQLNKCVNGVKVPTGATCPPPPGPGPTCTEGAMKDLFVCPDGTRIYLKKCENGVWVDTGERCPEEPECTRSEYFTCPDGTRIELYRCVEGKRVATGATCPVPPPPPPPDTKMVYVLAPLLSRVGKKIKITGMVYCGTMKVGGEKAWVTINGELLTTMNTSNGKLTATWTPVVPGLYSICATVPGSSACNAAAASCTTIQVVAELSAPEIAAAEAEFEAAKERIGQIMERI